MRTHIILLFIGVAFLMIGIYLSSLLTTAWIIIGTLMAVVGGGLTGVNTYYMATTKNKKS